MRASFKEIKGLLPSGYKLILDEEYKLPSDEMVLEAVGKFVFHRHFLALVKKAIMEEDDLFKLEENIKSLVHSEFGKPQPFEYTKDLHDCDNAAWELVAWVSGKGWPIGIGIVPGHALVVFINDKKEVKHIDQYIGEIIQNKERLKVTVMP